MPADLRNIRMYADTEELARALAMLDAPIGQDEIISLNKKRNFRHHPNQDPHLKLDSV